MKTFETEKHNIPEGATHYSDESESDIFAWFKSELGVNYLWCPGIEGEEYWIALTDQNEMYGEEVKPIPQTNIETPEEKEALDSIDSNLIKPREPSNPVITKVEWGGAGLPAVGVECLYAFAGGDYSEWFECEILYVGKQCVFIKTKDENLIKSFGCEELSVEICNTKFRKPETEVERAERERLEAVEEMFTYWSDNKSDFVGGDEDDRWVKELLFALHDAGYKRGKL